MWCSTVGGVVTLILSLLVAPFGAHAQPLPKIPRIGVLSGSAWTTDARNREAFLQGLRELGYVEGQTSVLEGRWAEGQRERLPALAAELVRLRVEVIVAGNVPAARAASQATQRIPIVLAGGDAVGTGLITNLARPGGNITGLTLAAVELSAKRLELLKEAIPTIARVAVLSLRDNPNTEPALQEMQGAARVLGVQLQALSVHDPSEFEDAFAVMSREQAEALVVIPAAFFRIHRVRLIELAARGRLPTFWGGLEAVADGGLMAYGPDETSLWRRAATYVDKLLNGAKPGDLPVEQPMKFELGINLKTAQALGITMPPSLLLLADEVIQ